jgi:hypothetical protein
MSILPRSYRFATQDQWRSGLFHLAASLTVRLFVTSNSLA